MSEIKIQDISTHDISGVNLLDDSESFMMELSDESKTLIGGNWRPVCYTGANGDAATYPCIETCIETGNDIFY